jgi:hypothetical protein
MPRCKRAGSKTPTADYDAGARQIDIDKLCDEEIQDIVITVNLTPRKCLGFKTPFQTILKELGETCKSGSHSPVTLGSRIQGGGAR